MYQSTNLPLVYPGIVSGKNCPALQGSFCDACNDYRFPRAEICPLCLGDVETADLGSEGEIYSHTTIRIKAPMGLLSPYRIGYVNLHKVPLRIFCLLDPDLNNELNSGDFVKLQVAPIGVNLQGEACLRPFFSAPCVQE